MIEFIYALIVVCLSQFAAILHLYFKVKRKKHRPDSVELSEFLFDLRAGGAMLHVRRIDPSHIVMRSPRDL
jgi:hypothetical protein